MAKRKKKKVTRRRKSSKVGAVDFTNVVASIVGGVGAKLVDKVLPAKLDPKMIAGAKVLIGSALPMVSKKAKTKQFLSSIGTGMAVTGSIDLLQQFGVVNGVEDEDDTLDISLSGDDLSVINGDDLAVLNDDQDDDILFDIDQDDFEDEELD